MRALLVALLLTAGLAGCSSPGEDARPFPLEVYRFAYPGSDVFVEGAEHGWLLRVTNPTAEAFQVSIRPQGVENGTVGPISMTTGPVSTPVFLPGAIEGGVVQSVPLELAPGASGVFMVKARAYSGDEVGFRALAAPIDDITAPVESYTDSWTITRAGAGQAVAAGDHVSTATVGVWTNGTSFYTNIQALIDDPDMPAGFDRTAAGSDPLPIYVYGNDRTEQPEGSKDACRFTTITGYNALLKNQLEGSTGVSLLRQEDAYTRPGAEDHFLYGDALIFLNTVISHDGATGPTDAPPNPLGPCFANRVPAGPSA